MVSGRTRVALAASVMVAASLPGAIGHVTTASGAVSQPGAPFVSDRLLVRFGASIDTAARQRVVSALGGRIVGAIPALDVVIVTVSRADLAAQVLGSDSAVAYAEPDYVARIMDQAAPRTPWPLFVPLAWATDDPLAAAQWHLALIRTREAWEQTRGAGVVIAVVDTGVDCTLGELAPQCLTGFDFVNEDDDASDDHGHGTDVASLAAAVARNGQGGAGVAPEARVLPVKVMGANGYGSYAAIAAGVVWAVDRGARVVNLSLGGYYDSATLRAAVAYAVDRGAVVLAAAGNDDVAMPTYPSAYPGVIGVAATDRTDAHWQPSNHGDFVDVSAPGAGVATTTRTGWGTATGTSEATPIVAGIAALVLSQDGRRSPAEVEQRIVGGTVDLGAPGWDPLFGYGRVDAAAAVAP
jgi:subtilisin family serine protease